MSDVTADFIVAGSGIFGAATALSLLEAGHSRVLLLDAWGVGNARATSGDHTRVIRACYGDKCLYSRWAWDALPVWKRWEKESGEVLHVPTGVLWFGGDDSAFHEASTQCLREIGVPLESWDAGQASQRFPQFAGMEDRAALWEPSAGILWSRRACLALVEMCRKRGAIVETGTVLPPAGSAGSLARIQLSDGRNVEAGTFVFTCGPWLRDLFPDLLRDRLRATRQELFYFAPPAGCTDFDPGRFPTWIEEGGEAGKEFSFYGMPALDIPEGRAVKIAKDIRGPEFDPTNGDRNVSAEGLQEAREYVSMRLPALANAPLIYSRVCQYEQTRDSHLIIDRHPEWKNVWIAGGGSGHGFKLAPSVARFLVAAVDSGNRAGIPESLLLR